jgi:hypothetical protein
LLQSGGANVYVRNYLICRKHFVLKLADFFLKNPLWSLHLSALTCNNDFEGGGWALVRRVKKGNVWFAANDNLRGTAEYGLQNARINDNSAFSIPYSTNLWAGTEFLFMMGMWDDCIWIAQTLYGWLSTRHWRQVLDYQLGLDQCWRCFLLWLGSGNHKVKRQQLSVYGKVIFVTMYRCSSCCVDTTRWWNSKNDASHPTIYMYAL